MENDKNKAGQVDNKGQQVGQQKTDPKANQQANQGDTIPKERLDAVLNDKKQLEQQLTLLQNQMEILKANMPQQGSQQPAQQQPKNVLDGIFTEGETVVEPRHLDTFGKKVIDAVKAELSPILQQLGVLGARIDNPDADDVLNNHFMSVVKSNPKLLEDIKRLAGIDVGFANRIAIAMAKTDPAYIEKQKNKQSATTDIEKQIADLKSQLDNAKRPLGMSAAGGGGTGLGGSKLSQTLLAVKDMTDQQFLEYQGKLKSGAEKLPTD